MRFSNDSIGYDEIIKDIESKIRESIRDYTSKNKVLPVDRAELFIKMLLTLKQLISVQNISGEQASEIINELYKSFGLISSGNNERNTVIRYDSRMNILKRLHGKYKVTISEIFRYGVSSNDILDYIWLRKHKLLYRSRDGKLVIDTKIYDEELDNITHREVGIEDIEKYLREIPSVLWPKILTNSLLGNIDNKRLIRLLEKYYGYNSKINRRLLRELSNRLNNGWRPYWAEWKRISNVIDTHSYPVNREKYFGPYSLERKIPSEKEYDRVLGDLLSMPLKERWKVVSKIYRNNKAHPILEKLDPITLSCIGSPDKIPRLKDRIYLGKAITSLLTYSINGDKSYLEYSRYFVEKIDPEKLDPMLKPIYVSMLIGDFKKIYYFLGRIMPINTIEYLSTRIWELRSSGLSLDRNELLRAISLGYEILKYTANYTMFSDIHSRRIKSVVRGRVDIRKTLFNYVRYDYMLARRDWERRIRINALIDVSGSMIRHSVWAILSLAAIMPLVKNIVLFSDKVFIYRPPKTLSRGLIINYLEKIFTEGFRGYTNISLALRSLESIAKYNDYVFLFSDLEQTVNDESPWITASKLISKTNIKLVVFVPPYYNVETADRIRNIGGVIVEANNLDDIIKWIRRKLNFKIRSKIFHVRD